MTPERRSAVVSAALTVAVVVVVALTISWLRDTAPTVEGVDLRVEEAAVPPEELLTCERLAEEPPDDLPQPGRATSGQVLECPELFDGLVVSYAGEVVGDVLRRDGGSWLLLNDDAYALEVGPLAETGEFRGTNSGLAVWAPSPQDRRIETAGRAGVRGDVVEVTGTVRRSDPEDGGGLTIRAQELEVLASAVAVDAPVHWRQVAVAGVLVVLTLLLVLRDRRTDR